MKYKICFIYVALLFVLISCSNESIDDKIFNGTIVPIIDKSAEIQKVKLDHIPLYGANYGYIALYDKNGNQVNIANIPEFADFAKSIGLAWGNDWTSKKEPWHFELANWRTRSDIAPEYRRRNNTAIA